MEAPDKVYIDDLAVVNDCITKISTTPLPNFSEYICKDALLKWAKEKYNKAYKLHLKKGDNYAYGQGKMDAYQKLIDKLNSM